MGSTSKRLSDEKAQCILGGLRSGSSLRRYSLSGNSPPFKAYCAAHPTYAEEALPLLAANLKAANHRKGDRVRKMTQFFCLKGLHPMIGDNVRIDPSRGRRACLACRKAAAANPPLMKPAIIEMVKRAFQGGATIGQICFGKPIGGGSVDRSLKIVDSAVFYRYRRENSEFDCFISQTIANNNSRGQRIRYARERTRAQTATRRDEANDYQKILAMFPANFPGKDDAAHDLFVAVFEGSLKREDIGARVKHYVTAHNRLFPTNFAKFGDGRMVSLDARLFDDGAMTVGDTISRGLWD